MLNTNRVKEVVAMARRTDRMRERLEAAGVEIEITAHEIVFSGNTYPIKDAIKSYRHPKDGGRFRWIPGRRVWVYTLRTYKNLRTVNGMISDGTIVTYPWPDLGDIYAEACRLLDR